MKKRPFKERYPTLRSFLKGDGPCHYIGDRYIEGTNILDRREWRGVADTAYDFGWWLATWLKMGAFAAKNPVRILRAFWRYRWLSAYLAAPHMVDKWIAGDRGLTLRCDRHALNAMISDTVDILWTMIRADRKLGKTKWTDKTVAFDYTLPRHIMLGFPGWSSVNINQQCAFMLPLMIKQMGAYYIDQSVSVGIPQDMCTLPLVEVGVAVEHEYPDLGSFWLCTNNPCDANMMDNAVMYRELSDNGRKAVHAFVTPLMYDDPSTKELGIHEVYEAIRFVEEQTGEKFNWDAFAQGLERVNQVTREELERWDIYATTNTIGLNAVCQGFFRIYFYQQSANRYFERESAKILKLFNRGVEKGINTVPYARHRAVGLELRQHLQLPGGRLALQLLGHRRGHQHGLPHGPQPCGHLRPRHHDERRRRLVRAHAHAHPHRGRQPAHPAGLRDRAQVQLRHDSHVRRHRLQGHGRLPGPHRGGVPPPFGRVPHLLAAARADGLPHRPARRGAQGRQRLHAHRPRRGAARPDARGLRRRRGVVSSI